jgi:hypothetical protein
MNSTTDRTADATTALLAALHAGGYAAETLVTGAVIVDGQHIDASAWDTMAMAWDGTADGLEDLGWDRAADAMRDGEDAVIAAAHEMVRDCTDPENCGEGETPEASAQRIADAADASALEALLRTWGCEGYLDGLADEAREIYARTARSLAREWLWARREEARRCHGCDDAVDDEDDE